MGKKKKEYITFHYRGLVERWRAKRRMFVWRLGFSENGPLGETCVPWLTQKECREVAEARGRGAKFSMTTEDKEAIKKGCADA